MKVIISQESISPDRHVPCTVVYDQMPYAANIAMAVVDAANHSICGDDTSGSFHPHTFDPMTACKRKPLYLINGRPC